MSEAQALVPSRKLVEANRSQFPNESAEYRKARNALLAEEIELRRHLERVAAQRPSWNGTAVNLRERVAIAVTARSPIERLMEYKGQRGFTNLPFLSDASGKYTGAYVSPDDGDVPVTSTAAR